MTDLPADLDSIAPDWLTEALGLRDARVLAYRRGEHAGGFAVTSLVARLLLELDRSDTDAPRSVFAKFPNPEFARTQRNCEAEIDFYLRVAPALTQRLPLPRCLYGAYDSASGRSVLLLEDLSDLRPGHPGDEGCDLEQARSTLMALADLQGATWCAAELAVRGVQRRPLFDDLPGWLADSERCLGVVRAHDRYPIDLETQARLARSRERLAARAHELDADPFVLVHDDLHTYNLLLAAGEGEAARVTFLDWQDTSLGHPARDLCQLLGTNVRPDVQRRHAESLLREYHGALARHGCDWSYEQSLRVLPLAADRLVLGYVRFLAEYTPATRRERTTLELEWQRMLTMGRVFEQLAQSAR